MSITVKDCLSLPSLSFGTVIAGKAGLDRIVSSISVLEFYDQDDAHLDVFTPNELVLSAFYAFRHDAQKQCEAVEDLINTGAIALVLFYVGKVLPQVDETLIQTADKHDFPLIVLENNSYQVKYSDIISDIMEAIIRDSDFSRDFIRSTEKRLAQIPVELRTMENLLRVISTHYKCNLLLCGSSQVYFQVTYRPSSVLHDPDYFYQLFRHTSSGYQTAEDQGLRAYKMDFSCFENTRMTLYASCYNTHLDEKILTDMCSCVGFFFTIWGYSLDLQSPQTLLPLILKTEESAAKKYLWNSNIDFARISSLIVISSGKASLDALYRDIVHDFHEYHKFFLADKIDGHLVILTSIIFSKSLDHALYNDLCRAVENCDEKASFFMNSGSKDIASIKRTYTDYLRNEPALEKIFLNRRNWDIHDIMLTQEITDLSKINSKRTEYFYDIIDSLKNDSDALLETLATYLIDCDSKLNLTADMLYLHRNTVTYRLNKAKQLTNTDFTLMPVTYDFYMALAIWRYHNI